MLEHVWKCLGLHFFFRVTNSSLLTQFPDPKLVKKVIFLRVPVQDFIEFRAVGNTLSYAKYFVLPCNSGWFPVTSGLFAVTPSWFLIHIIDIAWWLIFILLIVLFVWVWYACYQLFQIQKKSNHIRTALETDFIKVQFRFRVNF